MDTQLEELTRALESALAGMSNEQMSVHPRGKWCAAEVLEHLYLTYTGTIKGFEKVLQAGKPMASPASARQRFRTVTVTVLRYLPRGRKAPPVAEPRGLPPEKVRREWMKKIEEMDAIIAQCEARFGRGVALLDHPVLGPLTGKQWNTFHFVHGMHHRKQLLLLRRTLAAN